MAVTREQSATADGTDPTATFGVTPTSGNLLVAIAFSRSGTSESSLSISGSGWTKRVARDTELGNVNARRSLSVWTKVAGASEPTGITVSGDTVRLTIQEFEDSGGDDWTYRDKADNDNGTTSGAASLSSGTTGSTTGNQLLVGFYCARKGSSTAAWTPAFTNSLGSEIDAGDVSHGRYVASGFVESSATGTKETTGSHTGSDTGNAGLSAAILVFELVTAGAGRTTRNTDAYPLGINHGTSFRRGGL